jgi:hypothetical protein
MPLPISVQELSKFGLGVHDEAEEWSIVNGSWYGLPLDFGKALVNWVNSSPDSTLN